MASSTKKAKKPAKKTVERHNTSHQDILRLKPVLDAVQDALDEAKNNHIAETLLMRKIPLRKEGQ